METKLGDLLVTDCDNILLLNLLLVTYASHLISYKKNMTVRQSGLQTAR